MSISSEAPKLTVTFTDADLKELGFIGSKVLDEETVERCRNVPMEIAQTPVERIFGPVSSGALANRIAKEYPPLYRKLRNQAIELGIIAG